MTSVLPCPSIVFYTVRLVVICRKVFSLLDFFVNYLFQGCHESPHELYTHSIILFFPLTFTVQLYRYFSYFANLFMFSLLVFWGIVLLHPMLSYI